MARLRRPSGSTKHPLKMSSLQLRNVLMCKKYHRINNILTFSNQSQKGNYCLNYQFISCHFERMCQRHAAPSLLARSVGEKVYQTFRGEKIPTLNQHKNNFETKISPSNVSRCTPVHINITKGSNINTNSTRPV